jgi:hypothetical protein
LVVLKFKISGTAAAGAAGAAGWVVAALGVALAAAAVVAAVAVVAVVAAAAGTAVPSAGAAGVAVLTALLDPQLASVRRMPQLSAEARRIFMAERIGGRGRIMWRRRKEFRNCFSAAVRDRQM